jgi:hypothetical protein
VQLEQDQSLRCSDIDGIYSVLHDRCRCEPIKLVQRSPIVGGRADAFSHLEQRMRPEPQAAWQQSSLARGLPGVHTPHRCLCCSLSAPRRSCAGAAAALQGHRPSAESSACRCRGPAAGRRWGRLRRQARLRLPEPAQARRCSLLRFEHDWTRTARRLTVGAWRRGVLCARRRTISYGATSVSATKRQPQNFVSRPGTSLAREGAQQAPSSPESMPCTCSAMLFASQCIHNLVPHIIQRHRLCFAVCLCPVNTFEMQL